jgi:DNA-binding NtrC family response regulator
MQRTPHIPIRMNIDVKVPAEHWYRAQYFVVAVLNYFSGESTEFPRPSTELLLEPGPPSDAGDQAPRVTTIREAERLAVVQAIAAMRPGATWDEVADALGITKKTLWHKRKEFGLDIQARKQPSAADDDEAAE